MQKEEPTVNIGSVPFTRQQLFELSETVHGAGWQQVRRIIKAWEDERLTEMGLREFKSGITLADHLTLNAGKEEMIAAFEVLPANAANAHEDLKEIEKAAKDEE